jgi:DNA-binding IclR family transcriptional regulator
MERLSGAVRETVHLGVLDQGEVLYVDSRESPLNSFAASHIGKRNPVHCTALGKAMLAFLPDEEVASICGEKGFRKQTGQTILTLARLRADLAAARRDGYAVDDRELNEGTRCVAAPVRNHDGRVFAALSVSGPVSRVTTEAVPELGRMIAAAAAEISEGLGYVPK